MWKRAWDKKKLKQELEENKNGCFISEIYLAFPNKQKKTP